jgi:hypothetical protein
MDIKGVEKWARLGEMRGDRRVTVGKHGQPT